MSLQQQALHYQQLISQGVPPREAYFQAFPNGLPTAQDRAEQLAKEQQKAQLGQLVGALGGLALTNEAAGLITGDGGFLSNKIGELLSSGASEAGKEIANQLGQQAGTELVKTGVQNELYNQAANQATQQYLTQQAGQQAVQQGVGQVAGQGILSNAMGMGAGPLSAIATGTYLGGKSLYDQFITGEEDKSAQGKAGRGQAAISTGGLSEVARLFGIGGLADRKTTKEYQQERRLRLAEENPLYADYLTRSEQFADSNRINQALAQESTPAGFKGYWDNPETEENDMIWVNKQIKSPDRWNEEFFGSLGSGDVLHNMWFYENVPGYGDMSMQEKAAIADKALASGTATGHKGMINFDIDPNVLIQENQTPVVNTRPMTMDAPQFNMDNVVNRMGFDLQNNPYDPANINHWASNGNQDMINNIYEQVPGGFMEGKEVINVMPQLTQEELQRFMGKSPLLSAMGG